MLTVYLCYPDLRLIAYSSPMRGVRHVVSAMEVYRLHGDWLYSKNMLDKAVDMYIKTIGFLEPSAVIQKFLDCQELNHLALYLLHLHLAGCAMQQHTLLFFKCTARLKDDSLLACFLEDPRISKACSLSVALNECRLNGDIKLACTIASRHGYHDEYLSLLLETKEFSKAVELLKQVDAPAACSLLLKHGSALLEHSASDVLLLLSQFIKDYHTSVDIFIPLFVDAPDLLLLFLSLLSHGVPTASRLVPQYEALCGEARLQEAIEKARDAISTTPSIFGCSPFSSLLELLLRSQRKWNAVRHEGTRGAAGLNGLADNASSSVASSDGDASASTPSVFAETLLKTLKSRQMTHEDQYRSTLLCTVFGFEEGMVLVGEKRQELQLPVAYFEATNDIPNLLRFCLKNGSKDPTLWTQALNILASKFFVLMCLRNAAPSTATPASSPRAASAKSSGHIRRGQAQVFESERCDFCFLPVELPSVHFRCGHSFHIYCLSSNNEEKMESVQATDPSQMSYCCAICTPQFNAKRLLLSQREAEACNTDDFFKYLRGSTDGFDFILSCFGRGLFPSPLVRGSEAERHPE
ncbi:hypothetical protein ACSSS7_000477 [Eimeria intestinalis]